MFGNRGSVLEDCNIISEIPKHLQKLGYFWGIDASEYIHDGVQELRDGKGLTK